MTLNVKTVRSALGWIALLNYALLTLWFLVFIAAHDWMYDIQSGWFGVSVETFDALNFIAMAVYEIGILLFFLVPWVALVIVCRRSRD